MDDIKEVEIDGQGKFKYIQITVKDKQGNEKLIVRGHKTSYHSNILDDFQSKYSQFQSESPGGGRIDHDPGQKRIFVYGYSMVIKFADYSFPTCHPNTHLKLKYLFIPDRTPEPVDNLLISCCLDHQDNLFCIFQSFGQPDHAKTCELIRKHYPDYTVEWSNEGY